LFNEIDSGNNGTIEIDELVSNLEATKNGSSHGLGSTVT